MIDLDRWPTVAPLLEAALDLDGPERQVFMGEIADAEVRAEVERFLAYTNRDQTATLRDLFARPILSDRIPEGTMLGEYRVLDLLGTGGGGVVYRALDVRADKTVALKVLVLRPGVGTVSREIRALSRLDNPAIVRYLAAGTVGPGQVEGVPEGTLYLAMEYVEGTSMVEAADRYGLGLTERVRLLAETACAIQFALDRAVLHRDLKPANVLAAEGPDGRLHPKVLDFGLGVLLDEEDGGFTPGTSRRMTPAYAAPEQWRGEPATAATDVYGLGALGVALLTGAPPSETRAELGALPRDLAAVLTQALALDPVERYSNAGDFESDLQRVLSHRPVRAGGRRPLRSVSLFARRHAVWVGLGAVLGVALLAGGVRVVEAGREARTQAAAADASAAFLVGMLDAADPFSETVGTADTMRIGDVVRLAATRLDRNPPRSESVRARLDCALAGLLTSTLDFDAAETRFRTCLDLAGRDTTAWMATALRNRSLLHTLQARFDEAIDDAQGALAVDRRLFGSRSEAAASDLSRLGRAFEGQTELDSAIVYYRQALVLYRALDGGDGLLTATGQSDLGWALSQSGQGDDAVALLRHALAIRRRVLGRNHAQVAITLNKLGGALSNAGRFDEAERVLAASLRAHERIWGPDHQLTLEPLRDLAVVYGRSDRHALALPLNERVFEVRRRTLGPDHPLTLPEYGNVAMMYRQTGRLDEAIPLFEEGYQRSRAVLGEENEATLFARGNLADAYRVAGRPDRAVRELQALLPVFASVYGSDHVYTGITQMMLGDALLAAGQPDGAVATYRKAAATLDAEFPPEHPQRLGTQRRLGLALVAAGHREEGLRVLAGAVATAQANLPPDNLARVTLEAALADAKR